jgi:hypothetical protein
LKIDENKCLTNVVISIIIYISKVVERGRRNKMTREEAMKALGLTEDSGVKAVAKWKESAKAEKARRNAQGKN